MSAVAVGRQFVAWRSHLPCCLSVSVPPILRNPPRLCIHSQQNTTPTHIHTRTRQSTVFVLRPSLTNGYAARRRPYIFLGPHRPRACSLCSISNYAKDSTGLTKMPSIFPAFLRPGSPPRSPHVERPSFLTPFLPRSATPTPMPGHPRSTLSLKPTRRDVLLCLLTLSFAFLLFSPAPLAEPATLNRSSGGQYRLPGLSGLFHSLSSLCQARSDEVTFGESVKAVGFGAADAEADYMNIEGGWEAAFDDDEQYDEFINLATTLKGHAPGWTIFERLYIYNGSFYVVT